MKTIVEALKDLYVALGGKAEDVANLVLNPDVIEKIAAAAGDAVKPELPSFTGNAGKYLKVDSDADGVEWAEAGGGGGGGAVYLTETISGNAHTLSKNYNEIIAYIEAGNIVFLKEEPETGTYYCPLVADAVLGGVMHAITFEYYDTSDQTITKRLVDFMGMSATGALIYNETA